VELAGPLLDEYEARSNEHAGVRGEERTREAGTERELPLEQTEKPLPVPSLDGPAASSLNEVAQQPLALVVRRARTDLDGDALDRAARKHERRIERWPAHRR